MAMAKAGGGALQMQMQTAALSGRAGISSKAHGAIAIFIALMEMQ
jgi:hypothetical protein